MDTKISFVNSDLVDGILNITLSDSTSYSHVIVFDNNNDYIIPDKVTRITPTDLVVNLSTFIPIDGTWNIILFNQFTNAPSETVIAFTDSNIINGILSVELLDATSYHTFVIYDDKNIVVIPSSVSKLDNHYSFDLSSYGTIKNTWHLRIVKSDTDAPPPPAVPITTDYLGRNDRISFGQAGYNPVMKTNSGTVYNWGTDTYYLGLGDPHDDAYTVQTITGTYKKARFLRDSVVAIDMNGKIWTWGIYPYVDGLGDPAIDYATVPTMITTPEGVSFVDVDGSGGDDVVAIDTEGNGWVWSTMGFSAPGYPVENDNYCIPQMLISGENKWVKLFADDSGNIWGLDTYGTIWIYNYSYRTSTYGWQKTPGTDIFVDFNINQTHDCYALKEDGSVWMIILIGNVPMYPAKVSENHVFKQLSHGYGYKSAGALDTNGKLWCWYQYTLNGVAAIAYGNGTYVGTSDYSFTSPDLATWTQQGTSQVYLYNGAFGNGRFAFTNWNGITYTSTNGVTWSAIDNSGYMVFYGNGLYVSINQIGYIMTSPDLITWTNRGRLNNNSSSSGHCGVYGNGAWVIVNDDGRIFRSTNGSDWSDIGKIGLSGQTYGMTYGAGLFVYADAGGYVFTSVDGSSWTPRGLKLGNGLYGTTCAIFANNNFIYGCGNRHVYRSTDGINWADSYTATGVPKAIGYGDNALYTIGDSSGYVHVSSNGTIWNSLGKKTSGSYVFNYGKFGNGKYVFTATDTHVYTSTDSTNWTDVGQPSINPYFYGLSFVNGYFALNSNGYIHVSTDGITWYNQGQADYVGSGPTRILYTDKFVTTSSNGFAFISTDGIGWIRTAKIGGSKGLAYGNGLYVTCAVNGHPYTSTDCYTWTDRGALTLGSGGAVPDFAEFANNIYMLADRPNNHIYISSDGINWSEAVRPPILGTSITSIASDGSKFVMIDNYGYVFTSTNGSTWSGPYKPNNNFGFIRINYVNNQFVAEDKYMRWFSSSDGVTWTYTGTIPNYTSPQGGLRATQISPEADVYEEAHVYPYLQIFARKLDGTLWTWSVHSQDTYNISCEYPGTGVQSVTNQWTPLQVPDINLND